MIWLLGGYMWLFIHRPFKVWPWLGELRVERVYMLVTIFYWLSYTCDCENTSRNDSPLSSRAESSSRISHGKTPDILRSAL